jgi:hypothetical protein
LGCSRSGRDSGPVDLGVERAFEGSPCSGQFRAGGDVVRQSRVEFGDAGDENAGVGLRKEDGDPAASSVSS